MNLSGQLHWQKKQLNSHAASSYEITSNQRNPSNALLQACLSTTAQSLAVSQGTTKSQNCLRIKGWMIVRLETSQLSKVQRRGHNSWAIGDSKRIETQHSTLIKPLSAQNISCTLKSMASVDHWANVLSSA